MIDLSTDKVEFLYSSPLEVILFNVKMRGEEVNFVNLLAEADKLSSKYQAFYPPRLAAMALAHHRRGSSYTNYYYDYDS